MIVPRRVEGPMYAGSLEAVPMEALHPASRIPDEVQRSPHMGSKANESMMLICSINPNGAKGPFTHEARKPAGSATLAAAQQPAQGRAVLTLRVTLRNG